MRLIAVYAQHDLWINFTASPTAGDDGEIEADPDSIEIAFVEIAGWSTDDPSCLPPELVDALIGLSEGLEFEIEEWA